MVRMPSGVVLSVLTSCVTGFCSALTMLSYKLGLINDHLDPTASCGLSILFLFSCRNRVKPPLKKTQSFFYLSSVTVNKFLVSKETVVLLRWEGET